MPHNPLDIQWTLIFMLVSYSKTTCNIINCRQEIHRHFLCDNHYKTYANDDKAKNILKNVYDNYSGNSNLRNRIRFIVAFILHYTLHFRVLYREHFPLESLFIYHYRKIKSKSIDEKNKDAICSQINNISNDFAYDNNVLLDSLKTLSIESCHDSKDIPNDKINLQDAMEEHSSFNEKTFATYLIGFIAISLILISASKANNIDLVLYINLSANEYFMLGIILIAIGYYGIKLLLSVRGLSQAAQRKDIYERQENNDKLNIVLLKIKSNYKVTQEITWGMKSFLVCTYLYYFFDLYSSHQLNAPGYFLSTLLSLFLIYLLHTVSLIPFYYSNMSIRLWDLPSDEFAIDLYQPNGRMGLEEVISLINSGIIFNSAMLAVLWVILPPYFITSRESLIAYCIVVYFAGYFRVASLRRFLKLRKGLMKSIREKIETELNNLDYYDFDTKLAKYEFLKSASTYPIVSKETKATIKLVVFSVIVPVLILVIDNNLNMLEKFIDFLGKYLTY